MTAAELLALAASGAPLAEQRAALTATLADRGVGAGTIAHLMEHVRDGVILRRATDERRSHIGGHGLLPAGEDWPRDPNGHPMTFIAALDLAELPPVEPLPGDGTLAVFWDFMFHELHAMDFVAGTRAFWAPPGQELREQPQPDGSHYHELETLPLSGVAMPVAGEPQKVDQKLGDAPDKQALFDAMNELAPALYGHQLLGSSRDIQGPVLDEIPYWFQHTLPETQARFSDEERTGEGWTLLAQIEEDRDVPSLAIGDGGNLYFVIPEADLPARRFDRVMGIMQCH